MFFLHLLRWRICSPAAPRGPSHRRQFSMNCSTVSPSPEQQFSMNCCPVGHTAMGSLLQAQPAPAWAPLSTGSQIPDRTLIQCELLSPQGHRSLPGPCSSVGSSLHRVTDSLGHPLFPLGSSRGCRWISASPCPHELHKFGVFCSSLFLGDGILLMLE